MVTGFEECGVNPEGVATTSGADMAGSQTCGASRGREARRALVDREDMRAVYDAKPRAYKAIKRAADVLFSGGALLALSPVFLGTALAILIEDGRPVFYRSVRPGKDMRPFPMLKFRSMHKDADGRLEDLLDGNERDGAAFKIKDDPRITRVGAFIRKYSIDELPQLVNVLRGEMSLVGPRPIVPVQELTEHERQRAIVTPGLTCYWQVMGRTGIPWKDWVELDLDYIKDMSILTDAKILVRTFGVVFRGEGS